MTINYEAARSALIKQKRKLKYEIKRLENQVQLLQTKQEKAKHLTRELKMTRQVAIDMITGHIQLEGGKSQKLRHILKAQLVVETNQRMKKEGNHVIDG